MRISTFITSGSDFQQQANSKSYAPIKFALKLNIDVSKPPEPKKEEPKVEWPKISRDITSTTVLFGEIDKRTLPNEGFKDLERWVKKLQSKENEKLYDAIVKGVVFIHRRVYTSKSGTVKYNDKLAKDRVKDVDETLSRLFGSSAKLHFIKYKYDGQTKTERKADYSVDVYFEKEQAESVIHGLQTKKAT